MNTLISKVSTILLLVVFSLCGVLEANASRKDIIILMEGKLGKKGLRATEAEPVAQVQNLGNEIAIQFYSDLDDVIINVMDQNFGVVYFDYVQNPQAEYISLQGGESGFYYIQITTKKDTYCATIYKD